LIDVCVEEEDRRRRKRRRRRKMRLSVGFRIA
jgi:hypothetical protein